jgi:hypothetical protein
VAAGDRIDEKTVAAPANTTGIVVGCPCGDAPESPCSTIHRRGANDTTSTKLRHPVADVIAGSQSWN